MVSRTGPDCSPASTTASTSGFATGPYYECVAVSTSGDPLGSYCRYSFCYANFPDCPKVGAWPDAYYLTAAAEAADAVVWHYDAEYDHVAALAGQSTECANGSPRYPQPDAPG